MIFVLQFHFFFFLGGWGGRGGGLGKLEIFNMAVGGRESCRQQQAHREVAAVQVKGTFYQSHYYGRGYVHPRLLSYKPTSQENINLAVAARFLPDAYFARSVARRPIFLTLNNVVKSPSGRLTAATGGLFGHRPIFSANDKLIGRCPADVPATIARRPGDDRRGACRSPPDDNESCSHLAFTFW